MKKQTGKIVTKQTLKSTKWWKSFEKFILSNARTKGTAPCHAILVAIYLVSVNVSLILKIGNSL